VVEIAFMLAAPTAHYLGLKNICVTAIMFVPALAELIISLITKCLQGIQERMMLMMKNVRNSIICLLIISGIKIILTSLTAPIVVVLGKIVRIED